MSTSHTPASPWKGLETVPTAKPFIDALSRGEFVIQLCQDCGRAQSPARIHCEYCRSSKVVWQPASGAGTLAAITIYHRQYNPAYDRTPPYNVAMITLDNGAFVYGAVDDDAGQADVGRPVILDRAISAAGMPLRFKLA